MCGMNGRMKRDLSVRHTGIRWELNTIIEKVIWIRWTELSGALKTIPVQEES